LDKALDQFYEKGLKERQNALHSINKAVCKMINSQNQDKECQTESFLLE